MTTINLHPSAAITFGGETVHFGGQETLDLQVSQIRRVGPYIGAYHTESLKQARSTVFLDPSDGARSPMSVMALHLLESPLVIQYGMAAARLASMKSIASAKSDKAAEYPVAHAKTAVQARRPLATASGRGGF